MYGTTGQIYFRCFQTSPYLRHMFRMVSRLTRKRISRISMSFMHAYLRGLMEIHMIFGFFSKPAPSGHKRTSKWARYTLAIGLAMAVSGCAYDGTYGVHSGYSTYHHGVYYSGPVYTHSPYWRARAHMRQIQRHRIEAHKRIERQRHINRQRHHNGPSHHRRHR